MTYDPRKHHRHSIRLKGYDYAAPGAYFVTIVTHQRACLFGEIVGGEMRLNDIGRIADNCWRAIPDHFPNVELDTHVVMPNHLHGIIVIRENDLADSNGRGTRSRAPARMEQFGQPVPGTLATIIRQFKSSVTRLAIKYYGESNIWQRNYHDHIIRNETEWAKIRDYIETNPLRWADDAENPPGG